MSTTPQAPVLPFFLTVQKYLNSVATNTAAGLAAVKTDLDHHQKAQAVQDIVATAALDVATILPGESANVAAGLGLVSVGFNLFETIISLFHHPAAQAAMTATAPPPPQQ